jgi:hypothetical protein
VAIIQFEMAQTRGPLLPLGSQLSRQILNGCSDHLANPRTPALSLEVRCCSNEPHCPWGALVMANGDETMMEIDGLSGVEGALRITEKQLNEYDTRYRLGE